MLKFFRRRRTWRALQPYTATGESVADTNPDLAIRSLMDDPGIRRVLGLEAEPSMADHHLETAA